MPVTAEAVSATLTTNRNCTVEITNVTSAFCLAHPRVFMESGSSQHPPNPTIRVGQTEVCTFTKDHHAATGAVGLLTYDLFHMQSHSCTQRLAVMFSVPYDRNIYKNRLAVGLFENSRACDSSLYEQMYEGKDLQSCSWAEDSGSGLEFLGNFVELRASMSTVGKAIVKLEVYDKMRR